MFRPTVASDSEKCVGLPPKSHLFLNALPLEMLEMEMEMEMEMEICLFGWNSKLCFLDFGFGF